MHIYVKNSMFCHVYNFESDINMHASLQYSIILRVIVNPGYSLTVLLE